MAFWRVRMKVSHQFDWSTEAWDHGQVGVWYGAWTATEWLDARLVQPNDPWAVLRELPHQQELGWDFTPDLAAVRRLEAIGPEDWVVVFLRDRGEIGLARLAPGLHSEQNHPLNQVDENGSFETFKFRRLVDQKTFALAELPDVYRLLPTQGRGNVHQFHGMRGHVSLLADQPHAAGVRQAIDQMPFDQLIDILGASAWESVCTAYLILERGFVPTGLRTGSTLPVFDIVGRSMADGAHILAQCKKNPGPVPIPDEFLAEVEHYRGHLSAYYFAFGGCHPPAPANVQVIRREEILAWVNTEHGAMYRGFLVGD